LDAGIHAEALCLPWLTRLGFGSTAARLVAAHCVAVDLLGSDILGYYTRWAGPLACCLPWTPRSERLHFGSLFTTAAVSVQWAELEQRTALALGEGDAAWRLAVVGASLHAVHDFYAHSNWPRLDWAAHGLVAPTWHDVPADLRAGLDLHTATGHGIVPPPGRFRHDELHSDHPGRPGHAVACAAAERATGQWLERCAAWAGVGWGAMQAYAEQPAAVALDYRLLADLARASGHWQGAGPLRSWWLLRTGLRALARGRGPVARPWLRGDLGRRLGG
jgi:hypothetical protein